MFTISLRQLVGFSAALTMAAAPGFAQSGTPKAENGYTLSVFAKSVPGKYTKPDSIAVLEDHIYIGYGDGNDPAGADGKSNMIVEYNRKGQSIYSFTVKGHNDGLKLNPYTRKLWVMQNEDANPSLVIFDPETRTKKTYTFAAAPAAGGGYDDITFRNGRTYLSASNPQKSPNTAPAIVEAKLVGSVVEVTPVLEGDATATNILTGTSAKLNLQDPDSMTTTPSGDLLLDSQGDSELVVVRKPGAKSQSAVLVPLSSPYGQPQVDDTLFTPSTDGFILVTDTAGDTTYAIKKAQFAPGVAYSAGVAGTTAAPGFVGRLDLEFGELTPIVSGLKSPHGLACVQTVDDDSSPLEILRDACTELFGDK
jgi:hypothetical protein